MHDSRLSEYGLHGSRDGAIPYPFRVDVAPERDAVRVSPVGDVDLATVEQVREQLEEVAGAGFTRVILDLRQTTFLDSTGLRLALDVHSKSAADGFELAIVPGPPSVQRAFELAGLDVRLPFVDSHADGNGRARSRS